jgi:hypothetical protein
LLTTTAAALLATADLAAAQMSQPSSPAPAHPGTTQHEQRGPTRGQGQAAPQQPRSTTQSTEPQPGAPSEPKGAQQEQRNPQVPQRERTGETRDQGDQAQPRDQQRDRATQRDRGETRTRGDARSVQLTVEQRSRIHETVVRERSARIPKPNFSISVGTRIPRTVHVFDVPDEIVTVVPQYRGYKYIIVEDELVILDPDTLEIVVVIPA